MTAAFLLETFQALTLKQPDKPAFSFLDNDGEIATSYTYSELFHRSRSLSMYMASALKLSPGDRVLLVFPPSLDFMVAFLACLMSGVIAVPIFPPDPFHPKRDNAIFKSVLISSGSKLALTSNQYRRALNLSDVQNLLSMGVESLTKLIRWESIDDAPISATKDVVPVKPTDGNSVAFLQYTSGSTSEPKGVIIAHENLAHNLQLIITGLKAKDDTIVVSWLPQYHDMGLIGSYLGILYCGGSGYYLSPMTFIKNPVLWVRAISRYRGTHMQAPSFAYALTAKKFVTTQRSVKQPPKLDLSSVRHMINAAEPVDAAAIEAFEAVFAPYGLPSSVIFPTYGLAEHTVYVCSNGQQRLRVDKAALELGRIVLVDEKRGKGSSSEATTKDKSEVMVGCGKPIDSDQLTVLIVEPEARTQLGDDLVGEIWLHSPSMAKGYWGVQLLPGDNNDGSFTAQLATSTTGKSFLRTGDLGFMHNGELFICGRRKDLIIVHGRNYYPHDIEKSAEALAISVSDTVLSLRGGCSAAFGLKLLGRETVLLLAEVSEIAAEKLSSSTTSSTADAEQLIMTIRREISALHGVSLSFVGLLSPRTIPKTTSGKIARSWCKKAYLDGTLRFLHCWSGLHDNDQQGQQSSNNSSNIDNFDDVENRPELISPDAMHANKIDPTGLPLSFVLHELQLVISKVLQQTEAEQKQLEKIRVDIPLLLFGMDSAQSILLQAKLDDRFTIALPEELLFEKDATLTTIATSFIHGGTYNHRPIMVRGVDAIDGEIKRMKKPDNRDFFTLAISHLLFGGRKNPKKSNMKVILPPLWFREFETKSHVDTLRFVDGSAKKVVPMKSSEEYLYFYYALQLFGVFLWVPLLLLLCLLFVPWRIFTGVLAVFLVFVYLPDYSMFPPAFRTHYVLRLIMQYYSYRTVVEAPVVEYEDIPSIYCFGPHGVFGIGPVIQAMINGLVVGEDMHFLAANAVFSVSLYGMLLKMIGFDSVDRKNFIKKLNSGRSVGIIPGGIAEMFAIRPHEETMVVQSRKGFVRIALQTGTQIIPCYCFGNTQTFTAVSTPWLASLSRIMRMSLLVFWGRYGLPIPHRVPLMTVVGKPILCPKVAEPSAELVNEYHELYLRETKRIYETYKNAYDWQGRRLVYLSG